MTREILDSTRVIPPRAGKNTNGDFDCGTLSNNATLDLNSSRITKPSPKQIVEIAESLALERGILRSTFNADPHRIDEIDAQLTRLVDCMRVNLAAQGATQGPVDSREVFYNSVHLAYEKGQIHKLEAEVTARGRALGLVQARDVDESFVNLAAADLDQLVKSYQQNQPHLFTRYPELAAHTTHIARDAELAGLEAIHEAEKAAIGISACLRRFWPDFSKFFSILEDQDSESLKLVDRSMKQRYGVTILEDLRAVCSRPLLGVVYQSDLILSKANHIMSANQTGTDADGLALILGKPGSVSYTALKQFFERLDRPRLQALRDEFNRHHYFRAGGFQFLPIKFQGMQREIIESLMRGDKIAAAARELHSLLSKGHHDQIKGAELFESYSEQRLTALKQAFQHRFGISLDAFIDYHVSKPALRDRMRYWSQELKEQHTSACIKCAMEHIGKRSVAEYFIDLSKEERRTRLKNYSSHYNVNFYHELRTHLVKRNFFFQVSAREYYMARSVVRHGYLPDEEAIYQCVDGIGTDVHGIKEVLRHKRAPEIEELALRFSSLMRRRHGKPQNMLRRLAAETSGDDWHDVKQYQLGWPINAAGWLNRVVATHRHERSGIFRKIDLITREGPIMDRDVEAICAFYKKASGRGRLTPRQELRMEFLGRTALRDFSAFRRSKNALADQIANLAGAVGSLSIIIGSAELGITIHSNLPQIGGMVFCVSSLLRYSIKKLLKGDGYAGEEMARDVAFGGVDGVAPILAKFSPIGLLRRGLNVGAKIGGRTAVARVTRALHGNRLKQTPNSAAELEQTLALADGMELPELNRIGALNTTSGITECALDTLDMPFERATSRIFFEEHR